MPITHIPFMFGGSHGRRRDERFDQMHYECANNLKDLELQVNLLIKDRWEAYGSIQLTNEKYCQTLGRDSLINEMFPYFLFGIFLICGVCILFRDIKK
jgi:hypothetical protein